MRLGRPQGVLSQTPLEVLGAHGPSKLCGELPSKMLQGCLTSLSLRGSQRVVVGAVVSLALAHPTTGVVAAGLRPVLTELSKRFGLVAARTELFRSFSHFLKHSAS